jgi:hypothetical protein
MRKRKRARGAARTEVITIYPESRQSGLLMTIYHRCFCFEPKARMVYIMRAANTKALTTRAKKAAYE